MIAVSIFNILELTLLTVKYHSTNIFVGVISLFQYLKKSVIWIINALRST